MLKQGKYNYAYLRCVPLEVTGLLSKFRMFSIHHFQRNNKMKIFHLILQGDEYKIGS